MTIADELRVVRKNGVVNNLGLVGSVVLVVGLCGLSGAWGLKDGGVWWAVFGVASWLFGAAALLVIWSQANQLWDAKPVFVFRPDGFAPGSPDPEQDAFVPWEQIAALSAVTDVTYRALGSDVSARSSHTLLLARQPDPRAGRGAVERFDYPRWTVPGFDEVARYIAAAAPHVAVRDEREYGMVEQFLRDWGLRT
ncbi:hypothetical protein Srot_0107 [Segniliparus rotundus DSM 44985]|uniref:Uncharacterized protein n=2 Tax=Segniliparus rotundus TaxID=286802 RepID=D6Z9S1_SEGRD|nr:hypothetical protein Srot_0107 [Segniliparus rotundus DSM 44985]